MLTCVHIEANDKNTNDIIPRAVHYVYVCKKYVVEHERNDKLICYHSHHDLRYPIKANVQGKLMSDCPIC